VRLRFLSRAAAFSAFIAATAFAEPDTFGLGDGHDNALTVNAANTTINVYAVLNAPTLAGDTSVTVSSTAGFATGDLVMIWQSTGVVPIPASGTPSPFNISTDTVGKWELARITAAAGTTLTLRARLVNAFPATVTQVVRVPEYTSVTINAAGTLVAPAWNGSVGGVVAFLATGAVTNNGTVSVNSRGFRPASYLTDPAGDEYGCVELDGTSNTGKWANKGEGIANTRYGAGNNGRGNVANGAGGGDCNGSGGGGGGNGGQGGQGGFSAPADGTRNVGGMGGSALGYSLYDHITFGGAGAAGQMDDLAPPVSTGFGGGMVFIRAASLAGTGFIRSNGQAGNSLNQDGSEGGGAGGGLYLRFTGAVTCGGISANGGNGGNANATDAVAVGPGGGGAGGQVLIQGTSISAACTPAASSGAAGTLGCCGGGNYGATPPGSTANGIVFTPDGGFTIPPVPVLLVPANGAFTSPTPTVSGTDALDGSTVEVFVDGSTTPACSALVSGGVWSCAVAPALAAGVHTVDAVDTYQGTQSLLSNTNTFTVRTLVPNPPVILVPVAGSTVNTSTPTLSGTAEAGSIVTVVEGGTTLCTANADPITGAWSCVSAALTDGAHTITATARNVIGTSGASGPDSFFVRTQAPPAPIITAPAAGSTVNTPTPTISGTGEAGDAILVTEGGTALCATTVTAAGTWSCTSTPLADGMQVVVATAANGIAPKASSNPDTFFVRTLAPPVPVITAPAASSTVNSSTPSIGGTGEAGDAITVTESGVTLCTTVVSAAGTWSCTSSALADGSHTVLATASNGVFPNATSAPDQFYVRTALPPVPTIIAPANASVVNVSTPTLSGTGEAGDALTVTEGIVTLCTTVVTAAGTWSCTSSALVDGTHTIVATASNGVGTASSVPDQFWVRTQVPAAPVITAPANNSYTNNPQPTIVGTAEPGSTVTVTTSTGAVVCTATADSTTGAWSCSPSAPLADGTYTITATATNGIGTGPASNAVTFTVKTSAPSAPVIISPVSGSFIATRTPVIFGTDQGGASVSLTMDGTPLASGIPVDSAGNWAYALTAAQALADGPHTAIASAVDLAGNVSPQSAPDTFTVEATLPPAPVITAPTQGAVTGGSPSITGTAVPNSTVNVYIDGVRVGIATADASGNWSLTLTSTLANGPHSVDATDTNASGLTGPPSTTINFTVFTSKLASPVIVSPIDGSTIGTRTPTIIGTAPAGTTVHLTFDTTTVDIPADINGNWTYTLTPAQALPDGAHTAQATDSDTLGNTSSPSNLVHFKVLATAPNAPVIVSPPNGSTVTTATPVIIGTSQPGMMISVTIDGGLVGFATADSNGNWALALTGGLSNGSHTATATATDAAGNVSPPSAADTFTVNVSGTVVPAPVITQPVDGSSINTSTPTISGTAVAGATVNVSVDGTLLGTAPANGGGAWALGILPANALSAGAHIATATATVGANTSGPSNSDSFTVILVAPNAPMITVPANGSVVFTGTPTIAGTADPGVTVSLSVDGTSVGTAPSDLGGHWAYPIPAAQKLADGMHSATATATDAAGNVSATSSADTFTVDTHVPAPPVIATPPNNSVVSQNPPAIAGTSEVGSTVDVSVDGTHLCTVVAAAGTWGCTPPSPESLGSHTISATASNAIGTSAPATSVFIIPTPDAGTPDAGSADGGRGDGGSSDGGALDSGNSGDGGADAGAPLDLAYRGGGCGCSSGGGSELAAALALMALATRLRRSQRTPAADLKLRARAHPHPDPLPPAGEGNDMSVFRRGVFGSTQTL
jgi:MYXO-CTERM domain-containing protein